MIKHVRITFLDENGSEYELRLHHEDTEALLEKMLDEAKRMLPGFLSARGLELRKTPPHLKNKGKSTKARRRA